MSELVKVHQEGKVAVVEMDDGKANALSDAMIDAVTAALTRAEAEASAVVLAGRAERFCAGFDLRVMMSGPDNAKALLKSGSERGTRRRPRDRRGPRTRGGGGGGRRGGGGDGS